MNESNTATRNPDCARQGSVGNVFSGLAVIAVGMVFLAANFGIRLPIFGWHNWWALFIVFGAVAPVGRAIDRYRSVGAVDGQVAHALLSALAIVVVAMIFLLDASFARWWPVFLVIGGLSMLTAGPRRPDRQ